MESLRRILANRNKSQAWLARELGVTEATISRYVHGRKPDMPTLRRMAVLLDCEPEEITGEQALMTDDERLVLRAFRRIPADKLPAFWAIVNALASPPATPQGLSDQKQTMLPDRKESD